MAGLVPAIHDFEVGKAKIVDARHTAGHDEAVYRTEQSDSGLTELFNEGLHIR
jgi:hypothetical protein